ncbi:tail fiber protein [Serratia phage vB_SmaM-Kashira]|nr:tail fiber protein [Serratia phage vB_SmaM-Kashira]
MSYFFSPETGTFLPGELRDMYEGAGSWPLDSFLISDDIYQAYSITPPPDKKLGAGDDGMPAWVDKEEKSSEELEYLAIKRVGKETDRALKELQVIQISVELGEPEQGDEQRILELKRYINTLRKINRQPAYPAKIIWPEYP